MYRDKIVRAIENYNKELAYKKHKTFKDRIKASFEKFKNNPLYFLEKRKIKNLNVNEYLYDYNWDEKLTKDLCRASSEAKKIVIYTCITGGYDLPREPLFYSENITYVMFTTEEKHQNIEINGWNGIEIPVHINIKGNSMINRYIKLHPFELFADNFNIAIYIDGNIKPISDLGVLAELINPKVGMATHKHSCRKCVYDEVDVCRAVKKGNSEKLLTQFNKYKEEGFPKGYGLLECNVLVTNLDSEKAKFIYKEWWDELVDSGSGRDQTSLPYVCWKNNIEIDDIGTLGLNVYKNPKLKVYAHNNEVEKK